MAPNRSLNPETNSICSVINEGLVAIDEERVVPPALAVAWQQISQVELEFQLREGVRFLVASFDAHRTPT